MRLRFVCIEELYTVVAAAEEGPTASFAIHEKERKKSQSRAAKGALVVVVDDDGV